MPLALADAVAQAIENQAAGNSTKSVSGTESELLQTRLAKSPRMMLAITPVTAGVTIYLSLGEQAAALNQGIPLSPNQPFVQSANNVQEALQTVWQGPIHVIATGAGSVAVTEQLYQENNP